MLKRILALVVVLFLTLNISGQNNSYENTEQPYIEVIGTAELEVVPDEIFIRINIVEKSNNKSKVTIEEQGRKT
ncbi:MAG: hypothetical protein KatS3mg027_1737 [Bacteroidia bacterium]|nr:MAG: hypothetical protein KatS3mg027_1737 [Bacteroidia bacterium]